VRERRSYEETWFRRRRFFFDLALTSSLDLAFTKKKKPIGKQYLGNLGCDYVVVANDACSVADIAAMNPAGVLVSPGPGAPEESGISLEAVAKLGPRFPLFGVCMGHQCIGRAFGGNVVRAPGGVMHGKTSAVTHAGVGLLEGLPSPFLAARYHSLVIEADSCPDCLEVTARTQEDGVIMAVRHRDFPWVQGVQFHPESIITDGGMAIVKNFVDSLEAGATAGAAAAEQQSVAS
jgi:anthranilate synthase component 2